MELAIPPKSPLRAYERPQATNQTLAQMLKQLGVHSFVQGDTLVVTEPPKPNELDWDLYPLPASHQDTESASRLMQRLQAEVAPNSWASSGGGGAVIYFRGCPAIRQTIEVHDKIKVWLDRNSPANP